MVKVVVVDDSKQFQHSLTRLLSSVQGIAIVGYAEDAASARRLIDDHRPGIVVLDVELRDGDRGIDVLPHVVREHPTTKVVALSSKHWRALRRAYLKAGAHVYFDKALEFEQARDWIAACARSAAAGGDAQTGNA